MVTIPNIDGQIWNLEYVVPDLIHEYQTKGSLDISLNGEGPDATELGLYSILDNLVDKFEFDKSKITIVTHNVLEEHEKYNIKINPPLYVADGQKFALENELSSKQITKHFGIFISRSNWSRLLLSSEVFNLYKDKSIQTFHYNSLSDYHKSHLGLESLLHKQGSDSIMGVCNIIQQSPLATDIPKYPILSPEHLQIANLYSDFFVEIVCETYCLGKTFYPTEKIWRPLICKTPFIVQGPKNYLYNLKKLGFKTFADYWDESYDEDGEYGITTIRNIMNKLSQLSLTELTKLHSDMNPILEHNYEVFMSLKTESWNVFK